MNNMNRDLEFIHRFVPSSGSSNTKTLLLLHGTGGDEDSLLPIADLLLPGSAVLSPRGRVTENGMPRFFRRFSEGVFDLDDLRVKTQELAGFVKDAFQAYGLDRDKLIAAGYSNGANIAASLILSFPDLIKTAVLFHPMVPFIPEQPPDLSGTGILITAGTNDPIVSSEESERLRELFEDYGAGVKLFWHDRGHTLTREELNVAKYFLSESFY